MARSFKAYGKESIPDTCFIWGVAAVGFAFVAQPLAAAYPAISVDPSVNVGVGTSSP
jgi:hypothetical protein